MGLVADGGRLEFRTDPVRAAAGLRDVHTGRAATRRWKQLLPPIVR
jgi:hypothetical protein